MLQRLKRLLDWAKGKAALARGFKRLGLVEDLATEVQSKHDKLEQALIVCPGCGGVFLNMHDELQAVTFKDKRPPAYCCKRCAPQYASRHRGRAGKQLKSVKAEAAKKAAREEKAASA